MKSEILKKLPFWANNKKLIGIINLKEELFLN